MSYLHLLRQDCPLAPGTPVVVYLRDSGHSQQAQSVAQQREAAMEYARHFGLAVERIYEDEAKISTDVEKRAALNAMLDDLHARFPAIRNVKKREKALQARPFGVLFYSSSRLGRDEVETQLIRLQLESRALTVIDLTEMQTGVALADGILRLIKVHHDAMFLRDLSSGSKRGLASNVRLRDNDPEFLAQNPGWVSTGAYLGIHPSIPPRGFRGERVVIGFNKRTGKLREVQRIVPDIGGEWERAVLAWEMRLRGEGIAAIHRACRLYKTTGGYTTFYSNRIYTGDFYYGGAVYEGFVPAIVTHEQFEQEQIRMKARARKLQGESIGKLEPRRVRGDYLLSGIVWCSHVEGELHPMHGTLSNKWRSYACGRAKATRGQGCNAGSVSAKKLDKLVVDFILQNILTPAAIASILDDLTKLQGARGGQVASELEVLRGRLVECDRALDNLVEAIETFGASAAVRSKITAREQEREELKAKISSHELEIANSKIRALPTQVHIEEWIDYTRRALDAGGKEAHAVVRELISRIIINRRHVTIEYKLVVKDMLHTEARTYTSSLRSPRKALRGEERDTMIARIRLMRENGASFAEIAERLNIHKASASQFLRDADAVARRGEE